MTRPPSPGEILVGFSVSRRWSAFTHGLTRQSASQVWLLRLDPDFGLNMVLDIRSCGFYMVPLEFFAWKHRLLAVALPSHDILPGLRRIGRGLDLVSWGARCAQWFRRKWEHPLVPASGVLAAEALVAALRASNYPGIDLPDAATPQDLLLFFVREGSASVL